MNELVELLLTFTILANLVQLGSSRLAVNIRLIGAQGFALGLLPVLLLLRDVQGGTGVAAHAVVGTLLLAVASVGLKGIVFPWLLFRALREADVRHEVEPFVGFSLSIVLGVCTLGISLWLAPKLIAHAHTTEMHPLTLPTALFTVGAGLFLIVGRRKALNQVVGYLTLENGIYLFGLGVAREEPFLVEMGVLLDVFVAVFIMGITIFHISREFDHTDVDRLSRLKD